MMKKKKIENYILQHHIPWVGFVRNMNECLLRIIQIIDKLYVPVYGDFRDANNDEIRVEEEQKTDPDQFNDGIEDLEDADLDELEKKRLAIQRLLDEDNVRKESKTRNRPGDSRQARKRKDRGSNDSDSEYDSDHDYKQKQMSTDDEVILFFYFFCFTTLIILRNRFLFI